MIRAMTDAMAHRGPDANAFWAEQELAFGHRRLSIIDLSTAANQPFHDHTGRYVMVYNGEMYNYKDVRRMLPDYPFQTTSDTEVLLAAYMRWGLDGLRHFRGMFAFAIWDRQERQLVIARDRLGVKPLYYYRDGDRLLFASEVRSILASGVVPRKLDAAALVDYFSYQSMSYPDSPIQGIRQLKAGHWMIVKAGAVREEPYWSLFQPAPDFDFADIPTVRRRIRELMLQSVERRLVSDVPVGAFLSGGIDSSAVVGLMAEAGQGRPNTFTIAFEEKEYDESSYAAVIAKKFDTNHTNILLKPSVFIDELENALDALDSPSGDGVNTYVVSKAIHDKGMTVALSGAGGDELFAGYPFFGTYLNLRAKRALWAVPAGMRRAMIGNWLAGRKGKQGRIGQILQQPSGSIDELYPIFRQILSPGSLRELEFAAADGYPGGIARELRTSREALARLPLLSQVSAAEYLGYTQHTLLKDTDQMSMAHSLEVREPFFDQDLVEFVLAIPDAVKKPVYPKSLLVESLKPLLPDEIVHRRKQGFLFPWNNWLRSELREMAESRIKNMAQRSFIRGDRLMEHWKCFLAGDKHIRWAELWLFIVLEHWLEKNDVA
jgi:asparagine synthase (glutamine-hydrolysing)